MIGGVLEYACVTEFLGNLRAFRDTADTENPVWEAFITTLIEEFGTKPVTAAEVYAFVASNAEAAQCVPDGLRKLVTGPDDLKAQGAFTQALGYAFARGSISALANLRP